MGKTMFLRKSDANNAPSGGTGGLTLGDLAEGNLVKLLENGVEVEFYVAAHDYESSLNGSGRTLLVRNSVYTTGAWGSEQNEYSDNTMDTWFNSTYKALFSSEVQDAMAETAFYYTYNKNGMNTVTTLSRAIFGPSATELGCSGSGTENPNTEGSELSIASTIRKTAMWTRSPYGGSTNMAFVVGSATSKVSTNNVTTSSNGYLPQFTLPAETLVDEDTMLIQL